MSKLLILDKDGTLVRPKSGGVFPRHPEDQELIPGVAEAIARYAADGWVMAIASNQGGCQQQKIATKRLKPGQRVWSLKGDFFGIFQRFEGEHVFWCSDYGSPIRPYPKVLAAWKTLDEAIAEMRFCLELLTPQEFRSVLFCPDDGRTCRNQYGVSYGGGGYRKPDKGMIDLAIFQAETGFLDEDRKIIKSSDCLFVGDRPEDEQAAAAANIPFMWAHDWIKEA